jgi:prepilin-type N-terminal cleavage/methylation domain-containing protein
MHKQSGFTFVEIVIAVALVAALSFVGVKAYQNYHNAGVAAVPQAQVPSAPQIKTADDLTKAQTTLDTTDVDASSSDTDQLSSELSGL